jgi:membrane fusion protein (multidrug efflux system)
VTRNAAGEATGFFLTTDNKAEVRVITTGRAVGNYWLVTSGVKDGDRLVVDGHQALSDGSTVAPVNVEIDKDGVIKQNIDAAAGKPGKVPQASATE